MQKNYLLFTIFVCLLLSLKFYAQTDTNYVLNFNFNDHQIKETDNKVTVKPVGVTLADDRFGNKQSAIYLHGDAFSYLNLGTSNQLKPKEGTISLWVKLDRRVYTGKGYDCNPIIVTKNDTGYDFNVSYGLAYDGYSNRFVANSFKDSTKETMVKSHALAQFGKWYHFVITYDNNFFTFYVNGEIQQKIPKGFETIFLKTDSVVIGNGASKKNDRWSEGTFDDIQIFHRVLNEKEVKHLYEAPNPDRNRIILNNVLFYMGVGLLIVLVAFLLVLGRRTSLKKAEEKFKLNSKLYEMETKLIKSQMNPHFIFNSLNSIQQLYDLDEKEKAQYYMSHFSKLMRKMLENTTKDNLSLADEIDILNRYLEIESLRFNHVFKYSIDTAKGINAENTFIPHFLIQPLIENAIWHGLLTKKKGDKNLSISFHMVNENKISCIIDDNGVGRKNKEKKFNEKSFAINFIEQRLELMNKNFNMDLSLNIIDKKDSDGNSEGTKVILILPIVKSNNSK